MGRHAGARFRRLSGLGASAGVCLIAATTLAACGTSAPTASQSPKARLQASVVGIDAQSSVVYNFHLPITNAQLKALAPQLPGIFDGAVTGASIVVKETTANGQPLSSLAKPYLKSGSYTDLLNELKNENLDFSFNTEGFTLLELRAIGGVLYARVDVKDALGLFGLTSATLAHVEAMIPPGSTYDFARAALAGKWASFNYVSEFKGLVSTLPTASPAQSKMITQYLAAIQKLYDNDVTVATDGSSGGLDKLALSANEHTLAVAFAMVSTQLGQALGATGTSGAIPPADLAKVPNKTVQAFAGLRGDSLAELAINISQFIPGSAAKANPLELEVGISHPAVSISVPSGAAPINPGAFAQLFGGFGGAASGLVQGGLGKVKAA